MVCVPVCVTERPRETKKAEQVSARESERETRVERKVEGLEHWGGARWHQQQTTMTVLPERYRCV